MIFHGRCRLTLLLCLLLVAVWGQDAEQQQQQPQCDCADLTFRYDKCVDDWRALDVLRQNLEEQVRNAQSQTETSCQGQVEQARNELFGQLEQTRTEAIAAVQQARDELSQCQSQQTALNAQMEEQGSSHRSLQETSQQLEKELATIQSAKSKLEKDLSNRSLDLEKARSKSQRLTRELEETRKTMEEMIAAKTIITIDYDLLNQRIQEIQTFIMEYVYKFLTFLAEKSVVARKKALKFWTKLETEVFPEIERFVVDDVIPFWQSAWKQVKNNLEELYAPHRPTVNKQIKQAKKEWNKFYKQNLESSVKEYKLDQYYQTGKSQLVEHTSMAHDKLVEGVKTWSSVAHKFAKVEQFPPSVVKALKRVNSDAEIVAFYFECLIGLILVRFFLKMLFAKKKKGKKPRMTKKQWQEKQEMEKMKAKEQQAPNKAISPKNNGNRNTKKNK